MRKVVLWVGLFAPLVGSPAWAAASLTRLGDWGGPDGSCADCNPTDLSADGSTNGSRR